LDFPINLWSFTLKKASSWELSTRPTTVQKTLFPRRYRFSIIQFRTKKTYTCFTAYLGFSFYKRSSAGGELLLLFVSCFNNILQKLLLKMVLGSSSVFWSFQLTHFVNELCCCFFAMPACAISS
jgi:hypothetical protein